MAYSDDSVTSKLSTLSETQDSIVATSQWLLFHRRHADRTASLWLQQLRKSPLPKRLNLIYLANEVVQQSRARGKPDFLLAFEPIIAEATGVAYEGQGESVRGKVRRVVEVWRQRGVFEVSILDAVEARIAEIDRSKSTKGAGKLGGSLFGGGGAGGVPQELDGLAKSQAVVSKADVTKVPAIDNAEREFTKLMDPNATLPTPPVHAARLSALMRNLASAQGAVEACVKARRELVAGMEKLLETNRAKLSEDEETLGKLNVRKEGVDAKKREVEDAIMRGLSNPSSPAVSTPTSNLPPTIPQPNGGATSASSSDPSAPDAETFTPPPPEVETFTPELAGADDPTTSELPPLAAGDSASITPNPTGAEGLQEHPPNFNEPPPAFQPPPALPTNGSAAHEFDPAAPSNGMATALDQLQNDRIRQASTEVPASGPSPGDPRLKRRKTSHPKPQGNEDLDADLFGAGGALGIDEEGVSAMLAR